MSYLKLNHKRSENSVPAHHLNQFIKGILNGIDDTENGFDPDVSDCKYSYDHIMQRVVFEHQTSEILIGDFIRHVSDQM